MLTGVLSSLSCQNEKNGLILILPQSKFPMTLTSPGVEPNGTETLARLTRKRSGTPSEKNRGGQCFLPQTLHFPRGIQQNKEMPKAPPQTKLIRPSGIWA